MQLEQIRRLSPTEKEEFHRTAEARIKVFRYVRPKPSGKVKELSLLVNEKEIQLLVQTVRDGGENNLHYHHSSNTCWMVLNGRARFYGVGDVLLGELGPNEGILMPGGARYWFEKAGPEELDILQMVAVDRDAESGEDRVNIAAHKEWMKDTELKTYE
jgi:mannose-6-phosphate isomerase-like protein (cupin superfamily)